MESDDPPEDATAHFTDAEIRAVVDHYDDSDHPDALGVQAARALLSDLQAAITESWPAYTDAIRGGDLGAVADTGETFVLEDPERRRWKRLLDGIDCFDSVDRTVARVTHHQAAKRLTDRSFDGTDPVVVGKPPDPEAGQLFVEAVVDAMLRAGLDARAAWAYYGVEIRGIDGATWMDRAGYEDRISVADDVERARDRLGE